ncbi:MAG: two-component regulator propeller domain-containing protein [Bacteroidota bacterium]
MAKEQNSQKLDEPEPKRFNIFKLIISPAKLPPACGQSLFLNMKIFFFYILFILTGISFCFGQRANFRYYTVENGLPQSTVLSLFQDKNGYIWFGTQAGVANFNGKVFTNYNQQDGIADNHVTAIFQDSRDHFWFGHRYGEVTRWNGNKFSILGDKVKFKNSNQISDFYEDCNKNIWIATSGGGIFIVKFAYNNDTLFYLDSIKQADVQPEEDDSLSLYTVKHLKRLGSNRVYTICEDDNGFVWIGTNEGITVVDPKNPSREYKYFTVDDGLLSNNVYSIKKDKKGILWIATSSGLVSAKGQDLYGMDFTSYSTENLPDNNFRTMCITTNGDVWVGTESGAGKFVPGKDHAFKWFSKIEGLSNDDVSSIIEDSEGNIWMGTAGGGLCQYLGNRFETFDISIGLINNQVQAVLVDDAQNLWVGTENGISKIIFYDKQMTAIKKIINISAPQMKNKTSYTGGNEEKWLVHNDVLSIYQDSRGYIWFGTYSGVSRLNTKDNKIINYTFKNGLVYGYIITISEDVGGNIWLCSLGSGCSKFTPDKKNPDRGKLTTITTEDGLCSNTFWTVFKDSKGNLWFGSNDAGISVYDGERFVSVNENKGLTNKRPASIYEDKYDNIWIASIGGGIYKYDPLAALPEGFRVGGTGIAGGKIIKNYTTKDGLSSDNPYFIICDDKNGVWIGTNTGLDKLDSETGKIEHFNRDDGFAGTETNQNAMYKDELGNLWFGTVNGLVRYNPAEDKVNTKESNTYITNLRLFFEDTVWTNSTSGNAVQEIQYNSQQTVQDIVLSYNENHLTFDFIGLCFSNPEKVKYEYKLEGFDKDWNPIIKQTYVTYANLPPNEFTFQIKSCNNDDLWNKQPSTLNFIITPPFWQTWWFYSLCLLTAFICIYIYVRWREKKLRLAKIVLENTVIERTMELKMQNIKLEKAYNEIEDKNQQITYSIQYAKRIQEAILPNINEIKVAFSDAFILYQPSEIVSGDFYWFSVVNNVPIIVASDCTGHGVPAAFMSFIGNDLLNLIVNDNKIIDPAEVLTELDIRVKNVLKQEAGKGGLNEAMDIAICAFNPHAHIGQASHIDNEKNLSGNHPNSSKSSKAGLGALRFAGALRQLFLVRNKELFEYKPANYSVGGFSIKEKNFHNHDITLQPGDMIYIFSDGYIDQFGGPLGKKFLKKRFKQALIDIHHMESEEQHNYLNKTFNDWKEKEDQLDDILVIGIRF